MEACKTCAAANERLPIAQVGHGGSGLECNASAFSIVDENYAARIGWRSRLWTWNAMFIVPCGAYWLGGASGLALWTKNYATRIAL